MAAFGGVEEVDGRAESFSLDFSDVLAAGDGFENEKVGRM